MLYLLRHTHASDVRFLEAFHDDDMAHGTPLNAVGVLSRADEIGACRLDALEVAARVAARYQHDPRMRRLCPAVIPVAGLLGQAGTTLREGEYRPLALLAGRLASRHHRHCCSPPTGSCVRTPRPPSPSSSGGTWSTGLGLFGVRLSVELIRTRAAKNSSELAAELVRRSGLNTLRGVLGTQFTGRSRILKARSALATLRAVLDADGCRDGQQLRARAEEIVAGAHAFVEVRALNQLRGMGLGFSPDQELELERLLGAAGNASPSRLGLPASAGPDECREAGLQALRRWQLVAEHPLTTRQAQVVARVACRSLEGLLAEPVVIA